MVKCRKSAPKALTKRNSLWTARINFLLINTTFRVTFEI